MKEISLDKNWKATYVFEYQNGRPVVTELRIRRRHAGAIPDGGLTGRDLRRLNPLAGVEELVEDQTRMAGADQFLAAIADEFRGVERIGKGFPRPDSFYARVTQLYLLGLLRSPRKPAEYMVEALGGQGVDVTVEMTRAWIRMARARGWLEGGDRGNAGGIPSAKLEDWHREKVQERRALELEKFGPSEDDEDDEDDEGEDYRTPIMRMMDEEVAYLEPPAPGPASGSESG